jgi:hypothetical protein
MDTGEEDLDDLLELSEEVVLEELVHDNIYGLLYDEVKAKGYMYPCFNSMGWTANVHDDQVCFE